MTLPISWNQQTYRRRLQSPVSQNESHGESTPTLLEGRLVIVSFLKRNGVVIDFKERNGYKLYEISWSFKSTYTNCQGIKSIYKI